MNAPGFLPGWLESVIARTYGRVEINTSMPCLLNRVSELTNLNVDGAERKNMAHVKGVVCPTMAFMGHIRIHQNNGVYLMVSKAKDAVYARCTDCKSDGGDGEGSLVEFVQGSEKRAFPWARFTEQSYAKLIQKMRGGAVAGSTPSCGDKRASSSPPAAACHGDHNRGIRLL